MLTEPVVRKLTKILKAVEVLMRPRSVYLVSLADFGGRDLWHLGVAARSDTSPTWAVAEIAVWVGRRFRWRTAEEVADALHLGVYGIARGGWGKVRKNPGPTGKKLLAK